MLRLCEWCNSSRQQCDAMHNQEVHLSRSKETKARHHTTETKPELCTGYLATIHGQPLYKFPIMACLDCNRHGHTALRNVKGSIYPVLRKGPLASNPKGGHRSAMQQRPHLRSAASWTYHWEKVQRALSRSTHTWYHCRQPHVAPRPQEVATLKVPLTKPMAGAICCNSTTG